MDVKTKNCTLPNKMVRVLNASLYFFKLNLERQFAKLEKDLRLFKALMWFSLTCSQPYIS